MAKSKNKILPMIKRVYSYYKNFTIKYSNCSVQNHGKHIQILIIFNFMCLARNL